MSEKKKIGALWKKRTQSGKELWAGNVKVDGKKIQIAVFENSYKESDRQPDYVIYLDDYKPAVRPTAETTDDEFPSGGDTPPDDGCPF